MLKRVVVFSLIAASILMGCKKGENDPLISLKTRKSRLSGEWKVSFAEYSINDSTYSYDGTTLKEKKGVDAEVVDLTAEMNYVFEKSGKYSINTRTTYVAGYFGDNTPELTRVYLEEGIWNFTGGNNGTKSKSQLLLTPDRVENSVSGISDIQITVYENPVNGRVYDIDMLKDKSLRLTYETIENTPKLVTKRVGTFELEKL